MNFYQRDDTGEVIQLDATLPVVSYRPFRPSLSMRVPPLQGEQPVVVAHRVEVIFNRYVVLRNNEVFGRYSDFDAAQELIDAYREKNRAKYLICGVL